ncbi:HEAT repeat domain-containing protein [Micromonospora sp. NBC_01699]|uniref:HEAT repeat domain-containing protein n=1 Tax=Micromonospora sp. NBC_01699 TaxID=2975984 RepID=UPI003FA54283
MSGLSANEIVLALSGECSDRRSLMRELVTKAEAPELVQALRQAETPFLRQLICDLLARLRNPVALDTLLECLVDPSSSVRVAAADAIGKIFGYVDSPPTGQRPKVFAEMVARLAEESAPSVRSTLLQSLALLGDRSVRPVLEAALNESDPRVQKQATWGTGYLESRE